MPGLAQSAKQSGYQTLFAHPYVEKFWGRAKDPVARLRGALVRHPLHQPGAQGLYISDDALIDHLLKRTAQDGGPSSPTRSPCRARPLDGDRYRAQQIDRACPDQSPAERQLLNTYYTGVVDAMASLGGCSDARSLRQALYLVVAFGDHQPFLMSAGRASHGAKPPRDAACQIPMMAFTRADEGLDLARQFAPVRQLYQMGQATRALLAGTSPHRGQAPAPCARGGGLRPLPLVPQIRASFRADALLLNPSPAGEKGPSPHTIRRRARKSRSQDRLGALAGRGESGLTPPRRCR